MTKKIAPMALIAARLPDDVEADATVKDAQGEAEGIEKASQAPFFPLPPFPAGLDAQCDALWVFGLDE